MTKTRARRDDRTGVEFTRAMGSFATDTFEVLGLRFEVRDCTLV